MRKINLRPDGTSIANEQVIPITYPALQQNSQSLQIKHIHEEKSISNEELNIAISAKRQNEEEKYEMGPDQANIIDMYMNSVQNEEESKGDNSVTKRKTLGLPPTEKVVEDQTIKYINQHVKQSQSNAHMILKQTAFQQQQQ